MDNPFSPDRERKIFKTLNGMTKPSLSFILLSFKEFQNGTKQLEKASVFF